MQSFATLSSTESEYVAACEGGREIVHRLVEIMSESQMREGSREAVHGLVKIVPKQ